MPLRASAPFFAALLACLALLASAGYVVLVHTTRAWFEADLPFMESRIDRVTGAARDLTEALIVDPYDTKTAGDALAAAVRMGTEEQRERMPSMRRLVSEFNVYRWAGRMLVDAAELRRRERMLGRLGSPGTMQASEAT
jgi:hypothetical protein